VAQARRLGPFDGIAVDLDPNLTPGWYRARSESGLATRLLRFAAGPLPPWTARIDVGPEDHAALAAGLRPDGCEADG
jgi:hypothetical protein